MFCATAFPLFVVGMLHSVRLYGPSHVCVDTPSVTKCEERENQQDATISSGCGAQRPTTATNHIRQNQRSTPYAVTHGLCSPEDGHNDARNMLRQKLIISIWLLHLVGFLSLHTLLTMHGHRNLNHRLRCWGIWFSSCYIGRGCSRLVDFLCDIFRGVGACSSLVCCALSLFCVSGDYVPASPCLLVSVSKSKCWDGSQDSKLPLIISHEALPNSIYY